jgi:hypothetical protein
VLTNELIGTFDARNPAVLYSPDFITRSAVKSDSSFVKIIDVGFFTEVHRERLAKIVDVFNSDSMAARDGDRERFRKLRLVAKRLTDGWEEEAKLFFLDHMELELTDVGYGLISTAKDIEPDSHFFSEKARANCTSWLEHLFTDKDFKSRFVCSPSVFNRFGFTTVSPNFCRSNYSINPKQDLDAWLNSRDRTTELDPAVIDRMTGSKPLTILERAQRLAKNLKEFGAMAKTVASAVTGQGRTRRNPTKRRRTFRASRR